MKRVTMMATLLVTACGSSSGTGGKPASFELGFRTQPSQQPTFATASGWSITLTKAKVAVGPVYLYELQPPLARFSPLDLLIRPAYAHVGFDDETLGTDRGEFLDQLALDALATDRVSTGTLAGVAGPVHSATIGLDPGGAGLGELAGHSAIFEGTASKEGTSIAFRCALDLPESGTHRKVVNIPVGPAPAGDALPADPSPGLDLHDGASVDVVLHPARWFSDVNPDEFPPGNPVILTAGGQGFGAIEGGIRKFGAFTVEPRP